VALTLALFAACGRSSSHASSEVRIQLEVEPPHLNPLLGDKLAARVTLGDVYEPLWSVDPDQDTLVPGLAQSWTRSPDDREWIVTLRHGASWHDGEPFSSTDVVFTYSLLRKGGVPTLLAADFDDLEEVEARDEHTVRFRFGAFRVGRDRGVALVPILPAHVFTGTSAAELVAHPASRAPVGTGPYRFASWDAGRAITLARVRAPAEIDRVVYRVIPDRTQALAQLRERQLDVMPQVPGAEVESLAKDDRFRIALYDAPSFLAVAWNCRAGSLADPRTRRALTMLLDRETIVREIYHGRARSISGPWEPDAPAYDAGVAPWPFDPKAARALLDEVGVRELSVRVLIPQESRVLDRIATVWQSDAAEAGVTISVDSAPWGELLRRARAGSFDGVAFSWTTGPEQDFYHHFHSSQTGAENYGGVGDPELDRLLEQIRVTDRREARIELEHQLHRRLHELQPATFVTGDVRVGVIAARLQGARLGIDGIPARLLRWSKP
jgi:peptide/nickel transport system substrate-binding protein